MTLEQIISGVSKFVENEIAAPAPTGMQKFLYYAAIPFVGPAIKQMAAQYSGIAEAAGVLKGGQWDLSLLRSSASNAIKKSGPFEIAGIIFREEDLNKLLNYLQ